MHRWSQCHRFLSPEDSQIVAKHPLPEEFDETDDGK